MGPWTIEIFVDINECLTNNGNCSSTCNNTVGSYSCSCESGYALDVDGHNCTGTILYTWIAIPLLFDCQYRY